MAVMRTASTFSAHLSTFSRHFGHIGGLLRKPRRAKMQHLIVGMLLLIASPSFAATYYVNKSGSDSNSCATATSSTPGSGKLTAQAGINCAVAGDTVNIGAGTYLERLTIPTSGSANSRITITGTATGAQPGTIIDASESLGGTWVTAPEIGSGTYKMVAPTWTLSSGSYRRCSLIGNGVSVPILSYEQTDGTTDDDEWKVYLNRSFADSDWWNAMGAVAAVDAGNVYLRIRNGVNPNTLS